MLTLLTYIYDFLFGPKINLFNAAEPRSPKWQKLRDSIIARDKKCKICENKNNLNVHHIIPFHIRKDLELDESNLIVLCENSNLNCHLVFGHYRNWKNYNSNILKDIEEIRRLIGYAKK